MPSPTGGEGAATRVGACGEKGPTRLAVVVTRGEGPFRREAPSRSSALSHRVALPHRWGGHNDDHRGRGEIAHGTYCYIDDESLFDAARRLVTIRQPPEAP